MGRSRRRTVVTVTCGALLAFGATACGDKPAVQTSNPPPPEPTSEPAAPVIPEVGAADEGADDVIPEVAEGDEAPPLPTWDEVKSGHPEGATNPPIPELIVTRDGRCFKDWVPGMIASRRKGDRVEACSADDDCGTPIQCPERAAAIRERG